MRPISLDPTVIISVRLDPSMLAAVRERAHEERRSVSALIREAIYLYLTER